MSLTIKSLFASMLVLLPCISGKSQNPISPMGVYIADPSSRVGKDGRLYIYGSLDSIPSEYCSKSYHVLASKDLKKWQLYRNRFTFNIILYAPDMMEKDGTYYLYYDTSKGQEYVATSSSPTGPFTNGIRIEGPKQIDPNIFVDTDGQAYYFWGQFSAKGAKMNADMKTLNWSTMQKNILTQKDQYFHEGSYVVKRGSWYYYTFADVSRNGKPTCIGYAMSKSPMGPYEYKGVIIDNNGCDPSVWNNHGSLVEFKGKWYVLYHRATHGSVSMRKACIEPITFREDGTIEEVEMTTQGAAGPLAARETLDAARACMLFGNCRIRLMEGRNDREELGAICSGDAAAYKYLDFGRKGTTKAILRGKAERGGTISLHTDSINGRVIGELKISAHTDWSDYTIKTQKTNGVHALWLTFEGEKVCDKEELMQIDWIKFK